MKKLLLIATIMAGAASATYAGVNFSIGIGIPVPPPFVISHHPRAYYPPPMHAPACPPVVMAPRYCPPPVVVRPHHYYGYAYEPRRRNYRYQEHGRGGHHQRHEYRERGNNHRW